MTLVGASLPGFLVASGAPPDPLVSETFTGATVDPGFTGYGAACLTGAPSSTSVPPSGEHPLGGCPTPAVGPVPPDDAAPHGYLRLTDASPDQSAAVLYTQPVPANQGLSVTFDQWQYGGDATKPSPADGVSFFLVDGAGTLSGPGAFGGSLGYAQKLPDDNPANTFLPGVDNGYIGLGLDVLGNYFGDWEQRGNGCAARSPAGTNFLVPAPGPNVITLRGPGQGTQGYCWVAATATAPPAGSHVWQSTLPGTLQGSTTTVPTDPVLAEAALAPSARTVTVEVSPAPNAQLTVSVDFHDATGAHEVMHTALPQPEPRAYKFGFAASTGQFTDVHLLRNVTVQSLRPLPQLNLVKELDLDNPPPSPIVAGSVIHYKFVVTNSGGTPLTDLELHDPLVDALTCPASSLSSAQTLTCTGSHTVTAADVRRGYLHNTAFATASDEGTPVTSPPSEVEVPIARAFALELTKTVDNSHAYLPGDEVTYTYQVLNSSDQTITNLAVHDDRVTGITCAADTLTPAGTTTAATTCVGHYRVTQADGQAGTVNNTAYASGVGTDTAVLSPPDQAEIRIRAPQPPTTPTTPTSSSSAPPSGPTPPNSNLARTGVQVGGLLWWGLAALVTGAGLLASVRGRRRGTRDR
jgi:uncharacterized repeat protein (TIGR01451 family)